MGRKSFDSLMRQAYARKRVSDTSDYFNGYVRGLRRLFQGESPETAGEDAKWLSRLDNEAQQDKAHGYQTSTPTRHDDGITAHGITTVGTVRCQRRRELFQQHHIRDVPPWRETAFLAVQSIAGT